MAVKTNNKIPTSSLLVLALLFAIIVLINRLLILYFNSAILDSIYLGAVLISICNEFMVGLIISCLLFKTRNTIIFYFTFVLVIILLFYYNACFYYEAVFGRLPSFDVFYYLGEIDQLSSSLQSNIPVHKPLINVSILTISLYIAYRLLHHKPIHINNRVFVLFTFILLFISILLQTFPKLLPDKLFWGTRHAVLWTLQSRFIKERYSLDKLMLDSTDFQKFLYLHDQFRPVSTNDPEYPLCHGNWPDISLEDKANIIILILEGVGNFEMVRDFNGIKLMPNLHRIATENIFFSNFYAPGTKSVQALPAIFSGLPAHTYQNYLWNKNLLNFDGFPNILKKNGYDTSYLHGSDLSFERQRDYLKRVGFDQIIEFDPESQFKIHGWGYDDGVMFNKLTEWIKNHQNSRPDIPYLVTLFTLSTHDPYVLPPDWSPIFSENVRYMENPADWRSIKGEHDIIIALAESYAFLDYHLGRFYKWFTENTDNTILIITGDHTPHLVNDGDGSNERSIRFNVPFIIAGLPDEQQKNYKKYESRSGAMHDIPATVMGLLNHHPHPCNLGVNLLQQNNNWNGDRYIYSVGGDALERIYILSNGNTAIFDRVNDEYKWYDENNAAPVPENYKQFYNNIAPVHYYLLNKNAYFNNDNNINTISLPTVTKPIYISHRGNINGPGNHLNENRRKAIDKAIQSGFQWIEVDIQITRDGILVLYHDPHILIDGSNQLINNITLEQIKSYPEYEDLLSLEQLLIEYGEKVNLLIEVKPTMHISNTLQITREVSRIINKYKTNKRIIIDSFDETIARSIKQFCNCEVGFDTPHMQEINSNDLEHIRDIEMDWVYADYRLIDKDLIKSAHNLGLKIMAYTVNDKKIIEEWAKSEMPDGIITDFITIVPN